MEIPQWPRPSRASIAVEEHSFRNQERCPISFFVIHYEGAFLYTWWLSSLWQGGSISLSDPMIHIEWRQLMVKGPKFLFKGALLHYKWHPYINTGLELTIDWHWFIIEGSWFIVQGAEFTWMVLDSTFQGTDALWRALIDLMNGFNSEFRGIYLWSRAFIYFWRHSFIIEGLGLINKGLCRTHTPTQNTPHSNIQDPIRVWLRRPLLTCLFVWIWSIRTPKMWFPQCAR